MIRFGPCYHSAMNLRIPVLIVAVLALSACDGAMSSSRKGEIDLNGFEIPRSGQRAPITAEDGVRTTAADGGPPHGQFKITTQYGDVFYEDVREDGTFVSHASDGRVVETGTWSLGSGGRFCSKGGGPESTEVCFIEGLDANGVWTSYDPDLGETSTIERIAELPQSE